MRGERGARQERGECDRAEERRGKKLRARTRPALQLQRHALHCCSTRRCGCGHSAICALYVLLSIVFLISYVFATCCRAHIQSSIPGLYIFYGIYWIVVIDEVIGGFYSRNLLGDLLVIYKFYRVLLIALI